VESVVVPFIVGMLRFLNADGAAPFVAEVLRSLLVAPLLMEDFRIMILVLEPTLEVDIEFPRSTGGNDCGGAETLRDGIDVGIRFMAGEGDTIELEF
jgi:hypothetical protein